MRQLLRKDDSKSIVIDGRQNDLIMSSLKK